MTRLQLDHDGGRVVVGYDTQLATYYLEAGPHRIAPAVDDDPDDGLTTLRGRIERDLPDLAALLAELRNRRIALSASQQGALAYDARRLPPAVTRPRAFRC